MPFSLHPSGFCCYYSEYNSKNLVTGTPCPVCNRIAGHSLSCEFFKYDETKGTSSRPKLYNATAVLCGLYKDRSFLTFTLPSNEHDNNGTYQRDVDCPESGDLAVNRFFSMVLEAYAIRCKRKGSKLSYVWVAEAQTKRQKKFGGVGDIHYHVIVNQRIKSQGGSVVDHDTLTWLQDLWCEHVGAKANNCLHVDPIPNDVRSIPAYLCKYLGKGSQRMIIGRQFACTRDLSKFKPITLKTLPTLQLETVKDSSTPEGFELTSYYFNTQDVLEQYGSLMKEQHDYDSVTRTGKEFTQRAIMKRAYKRMTKELYPHVGVLGSSYST